MNQQPFGVMPPRVMLRPLMSTFVVSGVLSIVEFVCFLRPLAVLLAFGGFFNLVFFFINCFAFPSFLYLLHFVLINLDQFLLSYLCVFARDQ